MWSAVITAMMALESLFEIMAAARADTRGRVSAKRL